MRLLERTTRRIAVTELGRVLYAEAVGAIRALDDARHSVSALGTSPRGLLRVLVDDALADRAIAPLLPSLLREHPELRLELVVGNAAGADLVADGFDVAVALGGEHKDSAQLVRRVGSVDRVICAAPSWLAREPATLEALAQSRAQLSTIAALREAAVAGLGLIRVPRIAVADELRDGRLQEVLPEHAQRNVPVQTLQPGGRQRAPKAAAFVELLARELPARLAAAAARSSRRLTVASSNTPGRNHGSPLSRIEQRSRNPVYAARFRHGLPLALCRFVGCDKGGTTMDANVAAMQDEEAVRPSKKSVLWAGRIVSALPILALVMSGIMKLSHAPQIVGLISGHLGFAESALGGIGLLELFVIALYAIPATSVLGAVLVSAYLGGAVAAHVRVGDAYVVPILLAVLAWLGLYLRDARIRKLLPLRAA